MCVRERTHTRASPGKAGNRIFSIVPITFRLVKAARPPSYALISDQHPVQKSSLRPAVSCPDFSILPTYSLGETMARAKPHGKPHSIPLISHTLSYHNAHHFCHEPCVTALVHPRLSRALAEPNCALIIPAFGMLLFAGRTTYNPAFPQPPDDTLTREEYNAGFFHSPPLMRFDYESVRLVRPMIRPPPTSLSCIQRDS